MISGQLGCAEELSTQSTNNGSSGPETGLGNGMVKMLAEKSQHIQIHVQIFFCHFQPLLIDIHRVPFDLFDNV